MSDDYDDIDIPNTQIIPARIMKDAPVRECGTCNLCCKVLEVNEIGNLVKPRNAECPRLFNGKCRDYATPKRPMQCSSFSCGWLLNSNIPENLRPDYVGFFISVAHDESRFQIHCDPDRPDAWSSPEAIELIQRLMMQKPVRLYVGDIYRDFNPHYIEPSIAVN